MRPANLAGRELHNMSISALSAPLRGIVPPMVTPLCDDDTLNVDGLQRLIEHILGGVVHGLFILGTSGEATNEWLPKGDIAGLFLPNCQPIKIDNGNWIMAGRAASRFGVKPYIPAVAISTCDQLTRRWKVVPLLSVAKPSSSQLPKAKRTWPGRKKHKPPNPPRMLKLIEELESHIQHVVVASPRRFSDHAEENGNACSGKTSQPPA